MKIQILIPLILILFLSIVFSGCEEELKTICDETKATPIVVELKISLRFTMEFKNFNPKEGDKWWYKAHVNKCGELKPMDQSLGENNASESGWISHTFPQTSVYLDNEIDEVYIEGGFNSENGNLFTSKFLSYNELKPHMGNVYDVNLELGEISNTAAIYIQADVYETINKNEVPLNGKTVRFDITSSTKSLKTYYRTTNITGSTQPILIPYTFTKEDDYVIINATLQESGHVKRLVIDYDCYKNQYYDFNQGMYVLKTKANFDFVT